MIFRIRIRERCGDLQICMMLSGMVAPPCGYCLKASMTGLGRLTWMFMDRHGLPCRYCLKASMTGLGMLTWMFMDRHGLCAPPCGYCLKASMTAARSIHPVNRRVSDHVVPACALARRIPAMTRFFVVLFPRTTAQVRNDGE